MLLLDSLKELYNSFVKPQHLTFSHIDTGAPEPLAVFNQGKETISFNRIELDQMSPATADIDKAKDGIKDSSLARFLEIATSMNNIQAKEYGSTVILKGLAYGALGEEEVSLSRQEIADIFPLIKETLKEKYPYFFDMPNGFPASELPAYRAMSSNFKLLEHLIDSLYTDQTPYHTPKEKRPESMFTLK